MTTQTIKITVEFTEEQAWQLAQFLKRVSFNTALKHTDNASSQDEAYAMLEGMERVRRSLAEQGIAPR